MYRHLARIAEFPEPPDYQPAKPGEIRRNALDARRIRRELGWTPRVGLSEGLALVINAYQAGASDTTAAGSPATRRG